MNKLLYSLAVIVLLIAACSDKTANNGLLPLGPENSTTQTAMQSTAGDDEAVTITSRDGTAQKIPTLADLLARDPAFNPDTLYASDYLVSKNDLWTSHVVTSDIETGEVLSEVWYDFSTLQTGDHVVLFESGGFAIFGDYEE